MSPRPPRTDYPIRVRVARTQAGYIGQILGHSREILWECPPRSGGKDDPRGGPHHEPHNAMGMARQCAEEELRRGRAEGRYR